MKERAVEKIKIGTLVRDNDPRMPERVLRVLEFTKVSGWEFGPFGRKAVLFIGVLLGDPEKLAGRSKVRLDRIHTDGKPRRSGWSVVG